MEIRPQLLWTKAISAISDQMSEENLREITQKTNAIYLDDGRLIVELAEPGIQTTVIDQYLDSIANAIKEIVGRDININFTWDTPKQIKPQELREDEVILRLNPKFTFENFVVGKSNEFCYAACLAVSESPGTSYNPLFIYGGVGLGKTHLMQAIAHASSSRYNNLKLLYVTSEQFVNEYVYSILNKKTEQFRLKYRGLDLLLIDDVHFIAGKESTQEEFFHTFNFLYNSNRQIVLSSDRPPKEITAIEERLVSRFEGGLITDIQPPDLETRIAIIEKKAEIEWLNLPEDVILALANNIVSNIRLIEGALVRLSAYSKLTGQPIDIDVVERVLSDIFTRSNLTPTVEQIQSAVAKYYKVSLSDIRSKKRAYNIAKARQIAMYLARTISKMSLNEIGEAFGKRDHSTVIHSINKIESLSDYDQALRFDIDELKKLIKCIAGTDNK
ncbi:MAG: chromosomal replication initiator protein DnaA [bacterium]